MATEYTGPVQYHHRMFIRVFFELILRLLKQKFVYPARIAGVYRSQWQSRQLNFIPEQDKSTKTVEGKYLKRIFST